MALLQKPNALSYADLKEMAAERGLKIERSTICRLIVLWKRLYFITLIRMFAPKIN